MRPSRSLTYFQSDYNQLNHEYEKLRRELDFTQSVRRRTLTDAHVLCRVVQELKEKNTNFDKLKLEWDSNQNQTVGKHMQELAEERERALQVRTVELDRIISTPLSLLAGTDQFAAENRTGTA